MTVTRKLAVAVHGIEPRTFDRSALIRDWLDDHGVERVTLLVIPARDLHPLQDRRPEMADWLQERARLGDAIAQHGFQFETPGRRAEFVGMGTDDTRRAVMAGRRVLKLAGVEPSGFVAPAYAYTEPLKQLLAERFSWWAGLLQLHAVGRTILAPALGISNASRARRLVTPSLLGLGARVSGDTLRLDLHADDLDHPRHVLALDRVLRRAGRQRTAVTYDELAA